MADKKGMEKLADAMNHLADRLEKFQDPVYWQKLLSDAAQQIPSIAPQVAIQAVPRSIRVEEMVISLSEEERVRLANQVFESLQPQLEEFQGFLKDSLTEMPAYRLAENVIAAIPINTANCPVWKFTYGLGSIVHLLRAIQL